MPRKQARAWLSLALTASAISSISAVPAISYAGGFTITVIGTRRTGMVANMARPDDLTALFHNPAGLAEQPGLRFHASGSVTFLSTSFHLKALDPFRFPEINRPDCGQPGSLPCWPIGADGYYVDEIEPERTFGFLPYLGASTDLGLINPRWRDIVVSAAIYAPDFFGGFFRDDAPSAYHFVEGFFLVLASTVGVGWRINRYLSVGASLSYHYMRLKFAQKMSLVDALTPAGQPPDPTGEAAQALLNDLKLDYSGKDHGLGWILGLLFHPTDDLSFGFSYNGATSARFEGGLTLTSLAKRPPGSEQLEALFNTLGFKMPKGLLVEMVIPHALFWGVNYRPTPWLEIGLDYRLWLYTLFKKQTLRPFYDADDPDTLEEPLTEEQLSREKNYNLSYDISLGFLVRPALRRLPGLDLMAGVSFDKSPIPDETFTIDNPSQDQLVFSAGVRHSWRHWRLAATYMLTFHLNRDVRTSETSPPTNARGSGVAHMPGIQVEYVY